MSARERVGRAKRLTIDMKHEKGDCADLAKLLAYAANVRRLQVRALPNSDAAPAVFGEALKGLRSVHTLVMEEFDISFHIPSNVHTLVCHGLRGAAASSGWEGVQPAIDSESNQSTTPSIRRLSLRKVCFENFAALTGTLQCLQTSLREFGLYYPVKEGTGRSNPAHVTADEFADAARHAANSEEGLRGLGWHSMARSGPTIWSKRLRDVTSCVASVFAEPFDRSTVQSSPDYRLPLNSSTWTVTTGRF